MQRVGIEVVEDLGLGDLAVGDDEVVVVARAHVRGAPGDVDDAALGAAGAAHPDPVVDAERALDGEHQAGEEVAEDRLQGETEDQRGDGAGRQQRRDAHLGERRAEDQQRDDEIGDQERDADEQGRQAQPAAGLQVDLEVIETDDTQQRRAEEERDQPDEEGIEPGAVLRLEPEKDPDADRDGADDQRKGEQPEQAHVAPQHRDQSQEGRRGGDSGEESEDERIHALNWPCLRNHRRRFDRAALLHESVPSNDVAIEPAQDVTGSALRPRQRGLQDPRRRATGPARIPSRNGSGAWSARKRRIWRADTRQVRASSDRPAAS